MALLDILKTILLYLSMLYVSAVQVAPDPATVNITPSPLPTAYGIYATAELSTPTPKPVPTPAITANAEYGQLVMGDRNTTVKAVQLRLQELGYYTGAIDSAYGNQTRRAVEEFQYYNGLTVDGIAGKYTQTILFESGDVVAAPTPTPVFALDATAAPSPATATPQLTTTPTPTPEPSEALASTEEPLVTASPEPTATFEVSTAALLETYSFVMDGYTEPLSVQDTETLLHPVQYEETLYIPLTEILKNAGHVIIDSSQSNLEEIAFSVLTDFYQISFTVNEDGSLSDLVFEKNAQPQPLAVRSAVILDDVVYLRWMICSVSRGLRLR